MKMNLKMALIALGALVVVLIGALIAIVQYDKEHRIIVINLSEKELKAAGEKSWHWERYDIATAKEGDPVTRRKYNKIRRGMTVEAINAIMGVEPRNETDWMWYNPGQDSYMGAGFSSDGKLVSKYAVGLR